MQLSHLPPARVLPPRCTHPSHAHPARIQTNLHSLDRVWLLLSSSHLPSVCVSSLCRLAQVRCAAKNIQSLAPRANLHDAERRTVRFLLKTTPDKTLQPTQSLRSHDLALTFPSSHEGLQAISRFWNSPISGASKALDRLRAVSGRAVTAIPFWQQLIPHLSAAYVSQTEEVQAVAQCYEALAVALAGFFVTNRLRGKDAAYWRRCLNGNNQGRSAFFMEVSSRLPRVRVPFHSCELTIAKGRLHSPRQRRFRRRVLQLRSRLFVFRLVPPRGNPRWEQGSAHSCFPGAALRAPHCQRNP